MLSKTINFLLYFINIIRLLYYFFLLLIWSIREEIPIGYIILFNNTLFKFLYSIKGIIIDIILNIFLTL